VSSKEQDIESSRNLDALRVSLEEANGTEKNHPQVSNIASKSVTNETKKKGTDITKSQNTANRLANTRPTTDKNQNGGPKQAFLGKTKSDLGISPQQQQSSNEKR
jgi:hypothetical protein